ncbi:MAG: hypothetical protein VX438_16815, partial [Planctomycetota bacterium]|nr:hypothetical protein [Planctomycetota bacterium]
RSESLWAAGGGEIQSQNEPSLGQVLKGLETRCELILSVFGGWMIPLDHSFALTRAEGFCSI